MKSSRFQVFGGAALVALVVLSAGCRSEGDGTPEPSVPSVVVAEVNGEPVTQKQLDRVAEAERVLQIRRGTSGETQQIQLRADALELAIKAELAYQAAREAGITVAADAIEARLAAARSHYESEEEFSANLAEAGLDLNALKRETERRLTITAYVASIAGNLTIDPEEARRIFNEQKEQFREPDMARASQIIVRFLPGDSPERKQAARQKIEAAKAKLDAGADFAEVAREYSESPMAADGGDLGYFSRGRTLPELESVVFATAPGTTTEIFETRHGLNIVRVTDRRQAREVTFEEVEDSLFMVLAREQRDDSIQSHMNSLWDKADIRILDPDLAALGLDPRD